MKNNLKNNEKRCKTMKNLWCITCGDASLIRPPSSYLTSSSHTIFKNMAHVGSFSHFVFVFVSVFVFVFVFACVFVIVITFSSSAIIVFVILESYHFQKYGTCWVVQSFLLLESSVFVFVFVFTCVFVIVVTGASGGRQWIVRVLSFRNMYGYVGL